MYKVDTNISSDRTYFAGYCAAVKQPMFFGHEMMFATDPRLLLTHETALELASCVQNGKVIDGVLKELSASVAGKYGSPPLAELSYFDLHFGYLLPWIHAGPWGVLKSFWKYLLRITPVLDRQPSLFRMQIGRRCPVAQNTWC